MKRILSLQIRKFIASVDFLVFLGTAVMLSFVSVYFIKNVNEVFGNLSENILETFRQGEYYNFLIIQVKSTDSLNNPALDVLMPCILSSSSISSLLSICISRKITSEFQYKGFFVAVAKGYSRRIIYLSYNISAIVLTVILSAVYVISFALMSVVFGISVENVVFSKIICIVLTQIFMLTGYAVLCTTLSLIMQKAVSAILLNLSLVLVLPSIFSYMKLLYHIDFRFESYWILSRLSELTARTPSVSDFVISIITVVFSLMIGILSLDNIKIKNE